MKKKIILEETLKLHHEILVEGTEDDIEKAIDNAESGRACGLDDYADNLGKYVTVISVCDDYDGGDTDGIEYYDEEDVDD